MDKLLYIKEGTVVILIGAPASGKSTWAGNEFLPTQIVSSDKIREMLTDDENNQEASAPAFQILHMIVQNRIRFNRTVVIDATNTKPSDRAPFVAAAKLRKRPVIAVVFDEAFDTLVGRDSRRNRTVGPDVIRKFHTRMDDVLNDIPGEGYDDVYYMGGDDRQYYIVIHKNEMEGESDG